jgi:Arc/MetJ-type ribon-helix-helix transcriptional regulator
MTIHLPESLQIPILAAVRSGRYASLDDAMTEAASLLVQRLKQEQAQAEQPTAGPAETAAKHKPIWEEILELTADVPEEEWDKLPTDLAEQHDHYIYGTPKRPPSPRGGYLPIRSTG